MFTVDVKQQNNNNNHISYALGEMGHLNFMATRGYGACLPSSLSYYSNGPLCLINRIILCVFLLLSYDFGVNQWIVSCHRNPMTIHIITFWMVHVMLLTKTVSVMYVFFIEIMFILKAIKSSFFPGRIALLIVCLAPEPEVLGSIPSPTTYFHFSFR